MKTSIVIGANGFLGSALVNKLVETDEKVVAVYHSKIDKIHEKAELVSVAALLASDLLPDNIYFMSGNYSTSHRELLEINNFLYQCSIKFREAKMIYVSSANVYGNAEDNIIEKSAFNNPSLYATSKIAGEFIVSSMPKYSILRLVYVYGPRMTNNSFIPAIVDAALHKKKITLFNHGKRKQDYIYIEDAVQMCILLSETVENEIYLGASGISYSNQEVALEIKKYINCEVEYRDGDTGTSFYFDPKLSFEKLRWSPRFNLQEGIKKMLA